jgi:hypothetical protein
MYTCGQVDKEAMNMSLRKPIHGVTSWGQASWGHHGVRLGILVFFLAINNKFLHIPYMARRNRFHRPTATYHVMLRGNNGQAIFFSEGDKAKLCLLI